MSSELSVSVAEAARRLGVSERTAWLWVRNGTLPSFRLGGRRLVPVEQLCKIVTGTEHQ